VLSRRTKEGVEVEVRDTGSGMAANTNQGGSLGLALVSSLVKQAHGQFAFRNEGGTVFSLALPATV
jgi:two-component sensor histidine kinase